MDAKDLREKSNEELVTTRRELKEELLNLRIQQETGQLENSSLIKLNRRDIARIETLLSERRITAATEAAASASAE